MQENLVFNHVENEKNIDCALAKTGLYHKINKQDFFGKFLGGNFLPPFCTYAKTISSFTICLAHALMLFILLNDFATIFMSLQRELFPFFSGIRCIGSHHLIYIVPDVCCVWKQ